MPPPWLFQRRQYRRRGRKWQPTTQPAQPVRIELNLSEHTVRELIACVDASARNDHLTRIARKMLVEALAAHGVRP